jgi:hypothetical protein
MTGKAAFRRAAVQDIEALSELVIRSKASNGYSDEFMQAFMPELIVRPDIVAGGRGLGM